MKIPPPPDTSPRAVVTGIKVPFTQILDVVLKSVIALMIAMPLLAIIVALFFALLAALGRA